MASVSTRNADELTTAIKSLVDRALESTVREQVAARGKEVAAAIAETATTVAGRTSEAATEAWRETSPRREEAARAADRMRRDAMQWGQATWGSQLRPALLRAWRKRAMALGAAGGALPISKELVEEAKIRLGMQQRRQEERRWRTFFLGMVVGAIAGALVAILTAPRPGRETRDRIASRAREAAEGAGEWAPLFQRSAQEGAAHAAESGNGVPPAQGEPEASATEPAAQEDQPAG
jgi:gas vesicle protein